MIAATMAKNHTRLSFGGDNNGIFDELNKIELDKIRKIAEICVEARRRKTSVQVELNIHGQYSDLKLSVKQHDI